MIGKVNSLFGIFAFLFLCFKVPNLVALAFASVFSFALLLTARDKSYRSSLPWRSWFWGIGLPTIATAAVLLEWKWTIYLCLLAFIYRTRDASVVYRKKRYHRADLSYLPSLDQQEVLSAAA